LKKSIWPVIIYGLVIIVLILLINTSLNERASEKKVITYSEFITKLDAGEIAYAKIINDNTLLAIKTGDDAKTKNENINSKYDYSAQISSGTAEATQKILEKAVTDKKLVDYSYAYADTTPWYITAMPYLLTLIMVGVLVFFIYQQSQGNNKAMQFGRSTAKMYTEGKDKTTFLNVAGADEEKEELSEIVEFLKNPKKFTDMGARIPKGILLVGPPGTGKTLLAKAVAGEAGVPFFSITGSDFVELYVGVGASRVRDLFTQAKKSAPCIIFIDEIDAVGRKRGAGMGGGHDEREQTLNQLLVEMDGFHINEGIIILAATNRADILDSALLRSGRFDRQVHVLMPDPKGREEIFMVHVKNKKLAPDVSPREVALLTTGFTGADIENLLNESALLAVRRGKSIIGMAEIKDSITKVLLGPEKKSRIITDKERKLVAYHEAGHAILAKALPNCDPVTEVSIIPRGGAGGYTMTRPEDDSRMTTKGQLLDLITLSMGGRVAEELILGEISTGASSDIKHATDIARSLVTQYGMCDEIGPIYLGEADEIFLGRDFSAHKTYSEVWAAKVDEAVHRVILEAYATARRILTEKIETLHALAAELLEKEKIDNAQFVALYEKFNPVSASVNVNTDSNPSLE